MSITAITLGDSYQSSYEGLKTLFQTYGSAYFSNITYNDTDYAINCYISITSDPEEPAESFCLLRIVTKQSPLSILISTKYGFEHSFTVASRYFQGAYVTDYGITLRADNNLIPAFSITKDKNGNTTLVYSKTLTISNVQSTTDIYSVNINTSTPNINSNGYQTFVTPGKGDLVLTSLSPMIVNGDDGDYCENLLLINSAQFTMSGNYTRTWVIDDVDYWSNGLWVIKE